MHIYETIYSDVRVKITYYIIFKMYFIISRENKSNTIPVPLECATILLRDARARRKGRSTCRDCVRALPENKHNMRKAITPTAHIVIAASAHRTSLLVSQSVLLVQPSLFSPPILRTSCSSAHLGVCVCVRV